MRISFCSIARFNLQTFWIFGFLILKFNSRLDHYIILFKLYFQFRRGNHVITSKILHEKFTNCHRSHFVINCQGITLTHRETLSSHLQVQTQCIENYVHYRTSCSNQNPRILIILPLPIARQLFYRFSFRLPEQMYCIMYVSTSQYDQRKTTEWGDDRIQQQHDGIQLYRKLNRAAVLN